MKVNFKIYIYDKLITTVKVETSNMWDITWTWKALITSNKDQATKILVEVVEDNPATAQFIHNEITKQLKVIGY